MTKKLIVNADDFGRTPGVTEGILRAHREGIVTSATVLMNMPGAANALLRAKAEYPRLGLGVHLVFSSGRPLLPPEWVSSLVDKYGYFLSQDTLLADPQWPNLAELKSELKAQIKTFENAAGHAPDHIDAHHFAHMLPRFFEVYLELAQEFNLPARLPFPRNERQLAAHPPTGLSVFSASQFEAIVREDWELLNKHPVRSTDYFEHRFFGDEALTPIHLQHLLDGLPDGTSELLTHPGLADEILVKESRYNTQREKELELVCAPAIKQHITDLNIQLITFADL